MSRGPVAYVPISQAMNDGDSPLSPRRKSHIGILPDEILSEIQTIATHIHDRAQKRYRFPSVLSQISHRWRAVAYDTSRVWSSIFITHNASLEHLRTRLEQARKVPLEIMVLDLTVNYPRHGEIMGLLLPLSDQWISLHFDVWDIPSFASHFPESLPHLQDLTIDTRLHQKFDLNTSLPEIRLARFQNSYMGWKPHEPLPNLTSLHVLMAWTTVEELFVLLKSLPNLEVLEMHLHFCGGISLGAIASLLSWTVELPRLRALKLVGTESWKVALLLLWIRATALENLMLGFRMTPHFSESLRIDQLHFNFPFLRKIAISAEVTWNDDIQYILTHNPQVQVLALVGSTANCHVTNLELILATLALIQPTRQVIEVYVYGLSVPDLHRRFLQLVSSGTSLSLIRQVRWKISSSALRCSATEPTEVAEHEQFLEELRQLLPNMEGAAESFEWD